MRVIYKGVKDSVNGLADRNNRFQSGNKAKIRRQKRLRRSIFVIATLSLAGEPTRRASNLFSLCHVYG